MIKLSKTVIQSKAASGFTVVAVWIFYGCSGAQVDTRPSTTISVCDAFKDLAAYRNKKVAVRGIYWHGLRETCQKPFVTAGRQWPTALELIDSAGLGVEEKAVTFKTDYESWERLDQLLLHEARAGRHEEIWVTIAGEFRAQQSYVREDGQVVGGFGHLNMLPAEIIVERVYDIEIRHNPTYNYGDLLKGPRM